MHHDFEIVLGGHQRARPGGETAERHAGHVVDPVGLVHRKTVKQPVGQHRLHAAAMFLGRLENKVNGAAERCIARQIARRAEQGGGVAVMPAGMHPAWIAARPGRAGGFGDGERVHIGAQPDGPVAAAPEARDHAGAANPFRHLEAEFAQPGRNEGGGLVLAEAEFGAGVQMPAPGDHVVHVKPPHPAAAGTERPKPQFRFAAWRGRCGTGRRGRHQPPVSGAGRRRSRPAPDGR